MRIIYVAKHAPLDNQDELAIAHALRGLGHEVVCVEEKQGRQAAELPGDLLLFHKWDDVETLRKIKMKKVFWFFDLVDGSRDPMLKERSLHRMRWVDRVEPLCDLAVYTDGDWVAVDRSCKRRWLMQGADERMAGYGTPDPNYKLPPIIFTGMTAHGSKRVDHVRHLEKVWGPQFGTFGGGAKTRKHGRALADLYASVKIIIAPDGPSTDRYWSNRVYLTTSLGGFLIHPYCEGLVRQYKDCLTFYHSREECDHLIREYLDDEASRNRMITLGHYRTMAMHTYRHRCEQLIRMVNDSGL